MICWNPTLFGIIHSLSSCSTVEITNSLTTIAMSHSGSSLPNSSDGLPHMTTRLMVIIMLMMRRRYHHKNIMRFLTSTNSSYSLLSGRSLWRNLHLLLKDQMEIKPTRKFGLEDSNCVPREVCPKWILHCWLVKAPTSPHQSSLCSHPSSHHHNHHYQLSPIKRIKIPHKIWTNPTLVY